MELKDIAPGMLLVDRRGKLCVVTAIDLRRPKNPIVYKSGSGRSAYIAPPEFFRVSVGTVDLGKFETAMTVGTATRSRRWSSSATTPAPRSAPSTSAWTDGSTGAS
jgi:hypothetical protein